MTKTKLNAYRSDVEVENVEEIGDVVRTWTLDLGSSRIQLNTLGHTPTPCVSVKSCHLCFFPGEPHLLSRSLLTVLLQFALSRPGPLLYHGTCQYSACCGMR